MATGCVRLRGGMVYDPANGIDGVARDLWIENGKIVEGPGRESAADRTYDLTGYVVMAGGVEMHCHIAGPKVNLGRRFFPEFRPRDPKGPIHSTRATGRLFAGVGYTTAMDAAIPPLLARHAHHEFADTPIVDKGCYLLFDNNHFVLDALRDGRDGDVDAYIGWSLAAARGYGVKLVNPGGVESWKEISRKTLRELDEPVPAFGVSPRRIVAGLAAAADRVGLRHGVHIHANNLGVPGNWRTTLETMKALDGHRGHFAHIQFHSYDGDEGSPRSFRSGVEPLVDYVKRHPNITIDVGHIHPGRSLSMTGDAPFSNVLRRLTGGRWYAADTEQEASCGVLPVEYKPHKVLVHAVQWAIALEWYLMMDNPWRLAMTSDHPNGGAFTRYPEMIHLLMDSSARREALAMMPADLADRCNLRDLSREYTLSEIATITRAAPARMLGLDAKGHLGPGADADIAVYLPSDNKTEMFSRPRYVFKGGTLVAEDGEIRDEVLGRTLVCPPTWDDGILPRLRRWFEQSYSVQWGNYAIGPEEFAPPTALSCGPR